MVGVSLCASLGCAAELSNRCQVDPRLIEQTAQLRGLQFSKEVPCRVKSKREAREFVEYDISKNCSPSRIKYEPLVYQMLGLVPPGYDLIGMLPVIAVERVNGYYDPHKQEFVAIERVPQGVLNGLYVHELTHALQDHNFDFGRLIHKGLESDAMLAQSALFEGDAVLVQERHEKLFDCSKYTSEWVAEQLRQRVSRVGETPVAVELMLAYPYVFGPRYVCALLDRGGMELVNRGFVRPPRSTAEVMHLQLGEDRHVAASEMSQRRMPVDDNPEPLFKDRLGEFGLLALLATYVTIDQARIIAAGWAGDELLFYGGERSGERSLVWRITGRSIGAAKSILTYLTLSLEKRFPDLPKTRSSGLVLHGTPWGRLEVVQDGVSVELRIGGE